MVRPETVLQTHNRTACFALEAIRHGQLLTTSLRATSRSPDEHTYTRTDRQIYAAHQIHQSCSCLSLTHTSCFHKVNLHHQHVMVMKSIFSVLVHAFPIRRITFARSRGMSCPFHIGISTFWHANSFRTNRTHNDTRIFVSHWWCRTSMRFWHAMLHTKMSRTSTALEMNERQLSAFSKRTSCSQLRELHLSLSFSLSLSPHRMPPPNTLLSSPTHTNTLEDYHHVLLHRSPCMYIHLSLSITLTICKNANGYFNQVLDFRYKRSFTRLVIFLLEPLQVV